MLSGSENEPDGRERNGGGKGRGVRFAKRARPVSNLKGRFVDSGGCGALGLGGRFSCRECCCPSESGLSGGFGEDNSGASVALFSVFLGLKNIDGYMEKCRDDVTILLASDGCRAE